MVGNIKHVINIQVSDDPKLGVGSQSAFIANVLTKAGVNVHWYGPPSTNPFQENAIETINPNEVMVTVGAQQQPMYQQPQQTPSRQDMAYWWRYGYPYTNPDLAPYMAPPLNTNQLPQTPVFLGGMSVGANSQPNTGLRTPGNIADLQEQLSVLYRKLSSAQGKVGSHVTQSNIVGVLTRMFDKLRLDGNSVTDDKVHAVFSAINNWCDATDRLLEQIDSSIRQ